MKKFILKTLERIVISSFLLYGYNLIMQPLGSSIPINVYTISVITILGTPAFCSLILILFLIY